MSIKEPLREWFPLSRALYAFHMGGLKLPDTRYWRRYDFELFSMARDKVWESMLEKLNRAVKIGEVVLYGRPVTALRDFEQIPRDVWFQLESMDWPHGIATARDGSRYYSIHAGPPTASPESVAAVTPPQPKVTWGRKTQEVTAAMKKLPLRELTAIPTNALADRFHAGRTLCMDVRKKVVAGKIGHPRPDIPRK
jgi:hypothetical protein